MKNIVIVLSIVIVLVVSIIIIFSNKNENVNIDIEKLAEELVNSKNFNDNLSEVDKETIIDKYGFNNDSVSNIISYMGSGATAEEILIIEAKDKNKINEIKNIIEEKVKEKEESFRNYLPNEVYKIENSNIECKDKYIILCISNDSEKSLGIIKKYFNN